MANMVINERSELTIITLSDKLLEISDAADKAHMMLADVVIDYFGKYNKKDKEDHVGIVWDFQHNATYADIALDYVTTLRVALEELRAIVHKAEENKNHENVL